MVFLMYTKYAAPSITSQSHTYSIIIYLYSRYIWTFMNVYLLYIPYTTFNFYIILCIYNAIKQNRGLLWLGHLEKNSWEYIFWWGWFEFLCVYIYICIHRHIERACLFIFLKRKRKKERKKKKKKSFHSPVAYGNGIWGWPLVVRG